MTEHFLSMSDRSREWEIRPSLIAGLIGIALLIAGSAAVLPHKPAKLVEKATMVTSPATPTLQDSSATNGGWFDFQPANDYGPSAIGMESWLEAPAGKHGPVTMKNGHFVFRDGTRVKFWGTNHGNENCAPPKGVAPVRAQRLAKYGVNAVRLHKFTWYGDGIGAADVSTRLTPKGWDRLDFYVAELKKKGIYHGWSHIFGHRLRPGDKKRVLAYDEVMNGHDASYLKGSSYGLVMFAPDLQNLNIELTVNMLKHRNPYTGKTYAEEAALAFIEMQNEDDIFFPSTHNIVMKSPTYKKLLCQQFTDWVVQKYGSSGKALAAWGPKALNAYPEFQKDEAFEKRNLYPIPHQWFYGPEGLKNAEQKGAKQRLLDSARFLYETQDKFYQRFARAIRDAGYQGPLVGSCWQAGEGISHYYNLLSDVNVGLVDRHNYHGGQGFSVQKGKNDNHAMVSEPGSGLLSTGMQQVKGIPFALSEWTSLVPNEWVAEGPAVIAVYGMGLQGWDGSYEFANDLDRFSSTIQTHGPWVVDTPTQIGLYPALARLVYRGDVAEGKPLPPRRISLEELHRGEIGFSDKSEQSGRMGDEKRFASAVVPQEALAVGRVEVEFTKKPAKTVPVDLTSHRDGPNAVHSNTGQLRWEWGARPNEGFFTVNTPGTRAVVGFAPPGKPQPLGNSVAITPENRFSLIFVTATGKNENLDQARSALITVVARARNTGMRYTADGTEVLEVGSSPIQLEAVRAKVSFTGPRKPRQVFVLDHDGRRTDRTLPVTPEGIVALDGTRDRTLYYEVVF